MTRWQLFREIRAAMADPARIGDVPALKSELTCARARPEIEARLDAVRGDHPVIDLEAAAALPASTFGFQYAQFLHENGLSPIVLTGNLPPDLVARNAFVIRYGAIHDMVHVLTGFDTSWPGEIGVWSFVGAQNYSLGFRITAWVALLVAPFRCPLQLRRAWRCFWRGRALGRQAELLLPLKLEDRFPLDLAQVRAQLRLDGAADEHLPPGDPSSLAARPQPDTMAP
jgi:ubiquinone biosynthesis protein Coq4